MPAKVAVVTGAAGGIGRAYARGLAQDGISLVIADINREGAVETAAQIEAEGGIAVAAFVDVSDPASAAELARLVQDKFGRLDILVNNAALFGGIKMTPAMKVEIAYWRKVFSINLDGILIMTQALAPLIVDSGGGRIVNQSSAAAYMGMGDAYAVCKAAVNALTLGLAGELGAKGITVNAIAPGGVPTDAMKGLVTAEQLAAMAGKRPVARLGTTDDMLNALRFLVADASSWVTGQTLVIDGGLVKRL